MYAEAKLNTFSFTLISFALLSISIKFNVCSVLEFISISSSLSPGLSAFLFSIWLWFVSWTFIVFTFKQLYKSSHSLILKLIFYYFFTFYHFNLLLFLYTCIITHIYFIINKFKIIKMVLLKQKKRMQYIASSLSLYM